MAPLPQLTNRNNGLMLGFPRSGEALACAAFFIRAISADANLLMCSIADTIFFLPETGYPTGSNLVGDVL